MNKLIDCLPLRIPWAIAVDPSNLCNYRCQFCPTRRKDIAKIRPNGMMSLDLFKKIVDDLQKMDGKLKSLKLWKDGEPLLNKHLPEFIRYAKEKDVAEEIRITTNGSLIHKMAEELIDSGLDYLLVSFLSPKEKEYQKQTGKKGIRDQVIGNVEIIWKLRKIKQAKTPLISVKMCRFPFVTDEDVSEFKHLFNQTADQVIIHEDPMNWDNSDGDRTLGAPSRVPLTPPKVCPYPWYQMNINFNGQVSICCVDWSFKTIIGDVSKESVLDVWNGTKMKEFREMFTKQESFKNPACNNCTYYYDHPDNIDNYVLF